jgi:excinuclease ABC subunit C
MENLLEKVKKIRLTPNLYKLLPETPGVYVFFKDDVPIYIGKAINLKRRVSSYFDINLEGKTAKMVSEAKSLAYIKVTSEFEALLLEAKLIRKYMPHYNIAAKDDKHPLYIFITKEKYPRVLTLRKGQLNKFPSKAYFGPFPSSSNVRSVLRMLRRIFPYSEHKLGKRACLYSHIGLCNPCPNEIKTDMERRRYLSNINRIKAILSGRFYGVRRDLEREMAIFSKEQKYESAKHVRDQIERLDYITRPQMPTEFYLENPNLYDDQRKREIRELARIVKIDSLHRIECFDISHLAGTSPTASMVTFINGEADKNFYRHFMIKTAKGGDDYASMREVAKRRARHFSDWGSPDLIIVDGGLGQVKAFTTIIYINEVKIPIVGIAKHPDRLIIGDSKIKLTGPSLSFVSRIRDEAHRFARRYHHHLISKVYTNANDN